MTQRRILALLLLVFSLLAAGCTSNKPTPKPITDLSSWENEEIPQSDFFASVTVTMEKVDAEAQTATVSVMMPELENYLKGENDSMETIELVFPVQQVDGEWQIDSFEPLMEYIAEESRNILYEAMEGDGGVVIQFDPQEVPEN